MSLTKLQSEVLAFVRGRRKDNPISGAELIRHSQFYADNSKKGANMRAVINALRCKDFPICSNERGYFYPATPADIDATIANLEGRIVSIQKAVAGLRNGKHNFEQQQRIAELRGY